MSRLFLARVRGITFAAGCFFALSGCVTEDLDFGPKHLKPISSQMLALIELKGMSKETPILLRLYKEESELEVWKQTKEGRYELLKTYPICRWSGELGPKIREGDRQAPEGFYTITPELMNPRSSFYLAFNMGYPNEFDRALGRTGAHLMIHGDCSSRGCYAMTDEQIGEIFSLARESFDGGQLAFQVQAYPFRMTAKNLARHRRNPHLAFWRVLKQGSDHFELSRRQPKVDVCDKRYVFDANLIDPSKPFDPQRPCPAFVVPEEIATAVAAKKESDEREFAILVRLGIPAAPIVTGRDGGINQTLAASSRGGQSGSDDRFVAAVPRNALSQASSQISNDITASSGTGGSVPLPPADPRRRGGGTATAVSFASTSGSSATQNASASSGGSSFAKLFGFGRDEQKPAEPLQPAAATPSVSPSARSVPARAAGQTQQAQPVPSARPIQAAGSGPHEQDEQNEQNTRPASRNPAARPSLPGSSPILATDGFSYR